MAARSNTPKLRINATAVAELKEALAKLDALCSVGDESSCAVDDVHKEGVRLYVRSWIAPRIESALDRIEGRKESPRGERLHLTRSRRKT